MYYFGSIATRQLQIPISVRAMMRTFWCVRDRVTHALSHGLDPPENHGRHPALDDDIEHGLLLWIKENAAKKKSAATGRDVPEHIATRYDLSVTRGWVNSFVGRHLDEFCRVNCVL
jgi:hypothetical protein